MILDQIERWVGWIGGLAALVVLVFILVGIFRGMRRPVGRVVGHQLTFQRRPIFFLFTSIGFFGLCFLLWRPLPIQLMMPARSFLLYAGGLVYFLGLSLILWGRLTLGKLYFTSTSFGAQLFDDHRLISHGPYSLVRHPMYLGMLLAGLGGTLFYRTWTLVFITLSFLGLTLRARREEQALADEFGEEWVAYSRRVPPIFPRFPGIQGKPHPGLSALLEVGVMFLPAIPAYLWVWPNLTGTALEIFQSLVYLYVLAGTLLIGLRRWNLGQLGINKNGLGLSLACGLLILTGRLLIILSIHWSIAPPELNLLQLLGNILYLTAQVGLVEELLYRGLIYRALEDWLGARWAIWGSSVGFGLWHIFGQGPLVGVATLLIGLLFALLRWRAGGIVGLIFIHALWDLETFLLVASSNQDILDAGLPAMPHPALSWLGFAMMLLAPIYLWLLYPLASRIMQRRASGVKENGSTT